MLTIHVWPKRLKEFLLTHPLYKSPHAHRTRLKLSVAGVGARTPCRKDTTAKLHIHPQPQTKWARKVAYSFLARAPTWCVLDAVAKSQTKVTL